MRHWRQQVARRLADTGWRHSILQMHIVQTSNSLIIIIADCGRPSRNEFKKGVVKGVVKDPWG